MNRISQSKHWLLRATAAATLGDRALDRCALAQAGRR